MANLDQFFTIGKSPDLKHFKLSVHDLDACARKDIQNHLYAAFNKYLRALRENAKEKS